jgi:chromosome segregation ATPase
MWEKVVSLTKQLLAVVQKQKKHEEDIKELRQEVKDIRQELTAVREEMNQIRYEFGALTRVVERLAIELQHDRENAAREREIQRLHLENILLRHEHGLPPSDQQDDSSKP